MTEYKSAAELAAEVKHSLDKRFAEVNLRINEVEQRSALQMGGDYGPETKSWGQQFIERAADELKSFADNHSRPARLRMELKTVMTTANALSGGTPSVTGSNEIVTSPRRVLRVRNLIPSVPISTSSFEYPKQTSRINAADTVPEGTAKPESTYMWSMQTGTPKVIAHWVPASRQILDDLPQLMGVIDSELRYGLAVKEDQLLLNGSGTGENFTGLVTAATAYVQPAGVTAPANAMDQIGYAILQATLSDFNPNGIIMHPSDWMKMKLLKDAAGGYLISDPISGNVGARNDMLPMLHGLPIALTTSMGLGKFLVGDLQAAATIYDRWEPRVEVSSEHADFFTKNLVAILAEERLGLAIKRAGALIYGTLI